MVISMLLNQTVFASSAVNSVTFEQARKISVFEYKISEMCTDQDLTISCIKTATDFAGNPYTIVECNPTGYLVFCETSGVFVEYSPTAPSPYLNQNGELYYCGPTFYYKKDSTGLTLKHTIEENESVSAARILNYVSTCNQFVDYNLEQKNTVILNYIKSGDVNTPFSEIASQYQTRSTTYGYLTNYTFFFNMTAPCGYYCPSGSDGICGYVGLSLIIAYRDKYTDDNYMANSYWQNSTTKTNLINGSSSFAAYLRNNHGTQDGTYSATIKTVSESYFEGRGLNVTHTSKIWGLFNRNTIMSAIDDDNPVLLFGSLNDPSDDGNNINHAVVAYKYTDHSGLFGSTVYTAHFGWDNYSNIYVSGTIGSIYILS